MNKLTIVKVGGEIVEDEYLLQNFLCRVVNLQGRIVLVHGGRKTATQLSEKLGIETQMVNGRRITDAETLKVVTMVYAGLVNKNIVAQLQAKAINALGLTGADMNYMLSEKRPVKEIDYGFVGDVKEVNALLLSELIWKGITPVLSPITHDGKGQLLNTNADTIAGEAAKALAQYFDVTLVFCLGKKGVLLDENDDNSVILEIDKALFDVYKETGIINKGMIPKLENAFEAIEAGVTKVIITNADELGNGSGTTIIG